MKKQFFLALCILGLLGACNNSNQKPAQEEPPKREVDVKVQVEQPKPAVREVEINKEGVRVKVQDQQGNTIEIEKEKPK